MKRCPTCNKTYSDDSMSFCLEDGAPLLSVGGTDAPPPGSGSFDPNMTIPFTPPRDTAGQGGPGSSPGGGWGAPTGGAGSGQYGSQPGGYGQQGGGQSGWGAPAGGGPASGQFPPPQQPGQFPPAPGAGWGGQAPPPPTYGAPKKKSALPWIVGGIALLVVLGVAAAVVIGVLASMGSNTNKNNSNNSNLVANNRGNRNGSSNNSNNSNSANANNTNSAPKTGTPTASDDFSSPAWWTGSAEVGSAEYVNGEYHLRGAGGYMVIYGPKVFRTENATTRVTARSVSGTSPARGYGLAVFGEMKKNQLEDYCLLIRNSGTPAYKIVLHRGGDEKVLVDWTDASQIRTGTSPNQLEARASDTQLAFYINGQYVNTIEADKGFEFGLAGFYSSGTEEVAFDDLQIFK